MKFSMIFEAQLSNPTPEREHQLIHDCIEQCVVAEEVGFDGVWAVEHHALKRYCHMSAPEIFLTAVAARTKRIRIGHGVVCMPFGYNHPVRVAERAAMLDIISNGRLNLGAGRGGTLQERTLCQVDEELMYAQVEEGLKIQSNIWRKDSFEWESDLITIKPAPGMPPHEIVPRPVQLPHPPLFMACTNPETVKRAAEYGVGALIFGFGGLDSIREQKEMYDEAAKTTDGSRFVSTEVNHYMSALCPTVVMDDADEARRVGARGQRYFAESIGQWARPNQPLPNEDTGGEDNYAYMKDHVARILDQAKHDPVLAAQATLAVKSFNIDHAYGNAQDAIAYVEEMEKAGVDEVMCLIQMGTITQEQCLNTIRQWGEHVIPHFRAKKKVAA
ncbi:LLM class flavin-dependent oxidoreductase [Sphingomonas montanisoli]|uniref:LLM class flavin-dependent oxidoreductase n=1 Tax=Sphingomonas montanisoli TaxID=2606412 RepID=A0A5D9C4T1_9SPHN|nr:LLM class flavin-dependent oxidoreductase [Sphingomonas montanisoli]TZG26030.1 LLM class flavin-dependent oxidoreductase [Sphingomonas montanisoli]